MKLEDIERLQKKFPTGLTQLKLLDQDDGYTNPYRGYWLTVVGYGVGVGESVFSAPPSVGKDTTVLLLKDSYHNSWCPFKDIWMDPKFDNFAKDSKGYNLGVTWTWAADVFDNYEVKISTLMVDVPKISLETYWNF